MPVHALVASVWTGPEPAVFPDLDGFDEEFADFVGCGFGVTVFAHDDLAEFFCRSRSALLRSRIAIDDLRESRFGWGDHVYLHPNQPYRPSSSLPPPFLYPHPGYPDTGSSSPPFSPPPGHD